MCTYLVVGHLVYFKMC